jgi:hypothetical protein
VLVFSKIRARFLPTSRGRSEPAYFATLSSAAMSRRNFHSFGVKSISLTKLRLRRLNAMALRLLPVAGAGRTAPYRVRRISATRCGPVWIRWSGAVDRLVAGNGPMRALGITDTRAWDASSWAPLWVHAGE